MRTEGPQGAAEPPVKVRGAQPSVASGELTPGEAAELSKLVDHFTRVLEATDFEKRLAALERKTNQ